MKTNRLKWMRPALAVALTGLLSLMWCAWGCGGSSSSTDPVPVVLPAPTSGYMNGTAPDASGNVLLYGYIYADGVPQVGVEVTATNTSTSESVNTTTDKSAYFKLTAINTSKSTIKSTSVSTTTDNNAYFELTIEASVGDTIDVKYTDLATGNDSAVTGITVTDGTQLMSSATIAAKDVASDSETGVAVIVANDGTNSEILSINLSTGGVLSQASFTSVKFDHVAVGSSSGHIAVLDSSNKRLYWYDLASLSNDMAATSTAVLETTPHDVAVVSLAATPVTTDDVVVVSHDRNSYEGIATMFAIGGASPYTLGTPTENNCIAHPSDATYPFCIGVPSPRPTRATKIDLRGTSDNWPRIAILVDYDNGDTVASYIELNEISSLFSFNLSMAPSPTTQLSINLGTGMDVSSLVWYSDYVVFLIDSGQGNLMRIDGTSGNLVADTLTVGTGARAVVCDNADSKLFVTDQNTDSILTVDVASFTLSATTYSANYDPTALVSYGSGTTGKIGVILTAPVSMFKTLPITP